MYHSFPSMELQTQQHIGFNIEITFITIQINNCDREQLADEWWNIISGIIYFLKCRPNDRLLFARGSQLKNLFKKSSKVFFNMRHTTFFSCEPLDYSINFSFRSPYVIFSFYFLFICIYFVIYVLLVGIKITVKIPRYM